TSKEPRLTGIAVRHDHLGQGGAIKHGPQPAPVLITHGVEYHSLARMHRVAETPPLPTDLVPIDCKTHAGRLSDDHGFRKLPRLANGLLVIIGRPLRHRHDSAVRKF